MPLPGHQVSTSVKWNPLPIPLNLSLPYPSPTPPLASTVQTRDVLNKAPQDTVGPGLVTQCLSEEQWSTLDQINQSLTQEYAIRRHMLLTRCDVTIQSFGWSDRLRVWPHPHSTPSV